MHIKKIELYNFRQFKEKQVINFSTDEKKNVTILIGDNTSGKTTLVNAFQWCLYGDNKFKKQVLLNSQVRKSMAIGETQRTYVSITFSAYQGCAENTYELTREFSYKCDGATGNDGTVSLKNNTETLKLSIMNPDGMTNVFEDQTEISKIINSHLQKGLSDYFFFSGESISQIADQADLSVAVKRLLGLEEIEQAIDHIKGKKGAPGVISKFEKRYDTKGNEDAEAAKNRALELEEKIEKRKEQCKHYQEQYEFFQKKVDELNQILGGLKSVESLQNQRVTLETQSKIAENRYQELIKNFRHSMNNEEGSFSWGLPIILQALSVIKECREDVESIPDLHRSSIDFLLKRGYCLCGSELCDGNDSYNKLLQERSKLPPASMGSAVMDFRTNLRSRLSAMMEYYPNIQKLYQTIRSERRYIEDLQLEISKLDEQIAEYPDAKDIQSQLENVKESRADNQKKYDVANAEMERYSSELDEKRKILDVYASDSEKINRISFCIIYAISLLKY